MNAMHLEPTVRHDMVFLFDVTDGNPNGDPDAGNRPRVDDETSHGLVTDVALKRKVRDTIGMAALAAGADAGRYQIFVEAGHALNTRLEESYTAHGLELDGKNRTLSSEDADRARWWLTERYVDIRLFGAVLSTGRTRSLGQIRGPLQFGMASCSICSTTTGPPPAASWPRAAYTHSPTPAHSATHQRTRWSAGSPPSTPGSACHAASGTTKSP